MVTRVGPESSRTDGLIRKVGNALSLCLLVGGKAM